MPDQAKEFDLYTILAITHHLPITARPYRDILEYLSGVPIPAPTHALGVVEPCAEWLIEQHPPLRDVPAVPDFQGDEAAMDNWADEQKARLGVSELAVRPLPEQRRRAIPPYMERLLDHIPPSKVYVANLDEDQ
ncbi:hypothetical protein [Amycolatopsis sp. GM8]|uniref:hypothetical protein n=1 Tax=Amycolatopsis sp. GM8 TaxID=2896530 RepID=UPI001F34516B|nr:hypothetical protein [Amycolatopsis sp. GM8]